MKGGSPVRWLDGSVGEGQRRRGCTQLLVSWKYFDNLHERPAQRNMSAVNWTLFLSFLCKLLSCGVRFNWGLESVWRVASNSNNNGNSNNKQATTNKQQRQQMRERKRGRVAWPGLNFMANELCVLSWWQAAPQTVSQSVRQSVSQSLHRIVINIIFMTVQSVRYTSHIPLWDLHSHRSHHSHFLGESINNSFMAQPAVAPRRRIHCVWSNAAWLI